MDSEDYHDAIVNANSEQTWYFAISDCEGDLEVFTDDDTKKDHLLGLSVFNNYDEEEHEDEDDEGEESTPGLNQE